MGFCVFCVCTSAGKHEPEDLELDADGKDDLTKAGEGAEQHGAASVGGVVDDGAGEENHDAVGPGVHTVKEGVPGVVDLQEFQDLGLEGRAEVKHEIAAKGKEATQEERCVPDLCADGLLDGSCRLVVFHFAAVVVGLLFIYI